MAGSLQVNCPYCGVTLKAPREAVGHRVKCKKCGQRFIIGSVEEATGGNFPISAAPPPVRPEPPDEAGFDLDEEGEPDLMHRPSWARGASRGRRDADGERAGIRVGSVLLIVFGSLVMLGGGLGCCCFGVMDTSVPVGGGFGGRVHNVGLMQERMMGFVAGLIFSAVGLGMLLVGCLRR
jgi:hypothetical protein